MTWYSRGEHPIAGQSLGREGITAIRFLVALGREGTGWFRVSGSKSSHWRIGHRFVGWVERSVTHPTACSPPNRSIGTSNQSAARLGNPRESASSGGEITRFQNKIEETASIISCYRHDFVILINGKNGENAIDFKQFSCV